MSIMSTIAGAGLTAIACGFGTFMTFNGKNGTLLFSSIASLAGGVTGYFIRFGGFCGTLFGMGLPVAMYQYFTTPESRKQNQSDHAFPLISLFVVSTLVFGVIGYKLDSLYL